MSHRTVIILAAGAALTVAGVACSSHEPPTGNPPVPEDEAAAPAPEEEAAAPEGIVPMLPPAGTAPAPPIRTSNPPPPQPMPLPEPLPTWDAVSSGHPAGATNPPVPLLAINADGTECFKEWYDPRAAPREAMQAGGRILPEGEASQGTAVACPEDEVNALLGTP